MPIKKNNVKGQAGIQMIIAVVMIFIFAIVLFIGSFATQSIVTKLKGTSINQSAGSMFVKADKLINMMDVVFLIFFGAFIIGVLLIFFTSNFHPAVGIAFIILAIITAIIAVPFSQAYHNLFGTSSLISTAQKFPMSDQIMEHLPLIIGLTAAIAIIIMYSKSSGGVE